ncbi:M56 family metallopeptidase [Flavobacteriaceae bacterium TP-CH-4]|uniref:M56 family metallopeptidase n=1 Tax=Pelagihabitans pacificus TaxID=2696054 RepID=A0A967AXL8_9FLAO|nr:M56 family metallopeptidase [Pelagihabitans pacificus]NHF58451.1 M56 family metallopeptidase [Pelagihabitans pacificus]
MWLYLFKSTACLAVLLLFYKLFLERESIHVFKRFYLLGALLFSLMVPALVFKEEVVMLYPSVETVTSSVTYGNTNPIPGVPQKLEADMTDFSVLLWTAYFLGLAFFGIRFLKNLVQIVRRIRSNPKVRVAPFIRVLLGENMPPHTFFSYIFLNKGKLESNTIPDEVLLHEETHARQKHSIDVLLIEILQVILWFNPLVYVLRKSIKLNHEFLADSAVLKKGVASSTYQNTLLSFMTPTGNQAFVNAINYSSIKKRFTVMKTHTSKKSIFLRSTLLLPLLALLFGAFTETKIVEIPAGKISPSERITPAGHIEIFIDNEGRLTLQEEIVALEDLKDFLENYGTDLSKEERRNQLRVSIYPKENVPPRTIEEVNKIVMDYGVATINIVGPENGNTYSSSQKGATKQQLIKYNGLAKKYSAQPIENRMVPLKDLQVLEAIYQKMTALQKKSAQPFPECQTIENIHIYIQDDEQLLVNGEPITLDELAILLPKFNVQIDRKERQNNVRSYINTKANVSETTLQEIEAALESYGVAMIDIVGPKENTSRREQQSASREEMREYNALAKKYNAMLASDTSIRIKKKELDRMTYIYDLMSDKQKQDAEPFPDFPKRPAPPQAPQAAMAPLQQVDQVEEAEEMQEADEMEEIIELPPAPPSPPSPLDHVIEMAKKGATFYYEGQKVSSDRAIELLKNNKNLNIDSRGSGGKHPEVRISKNSIFIEN